MLPRVPNLSGKKDMTRREEDDDSFQRFLRHSDKVFRDARFVADSLPNVEPFAVERALCRLQAVHHILINTQDPWVKPDEVKLLADSVVSLGQVLEAFQAAPPLPRNTGTTTLPSTGGRPLYELDVERALNLHGMGNPWESVADAMGISRKTMYNHLRRAGLSGRPEFTDMSDEELDEVVAEISIRHPFAGSLIVDGHLKAKGIRVARERVRESLRRVDALGTMAR